MTTRSKFNDCIFYFIKKKKKKKFIFINLSTLNSNVFLYLI